MSAVFNMPENVNSDLLIISKVMGVIVALALIAILILI